MSTRWRTAGAAAVVVAVLGAVAGFSGGTAPPALADHLPPQTGGFSLLTYNVAGLPEPFSGSEPATNTPLISPLLNGYDVVVVQEDWVDPVPPIDGVDFHHDDLIASATHAYLSTPATPPLGTDPRRPEAIVADGLNYLSRLPFGDVYRQMWPGCYGGADFGAADCLSQKGFAATRLEIAPGVTVDLYNLHAEAGGSDEDRYWSAQDYLVLAEFITTYSVGQTVIVAGDTNLHTDDAVDGPVWAGFLAATGLHDVCELVACGADADVIDKVAIRSGPVVELTALSHQFERALFERSDGQPLSDHDPLAVELAWQAPAAEELPPSTAVPFPTGTPTTTSTTAPGSVTSTALPATVTPAAVTPAFTG